jgi:hypothetical protein
MCYGVGVESDEALAAKLAEIRPFLDERQWRLVLGAEARARGRGGIKLVAAAAGVDPDTVGRGARELERGVVPDGRVRGKGAGRPPVTEVHPGVLPALRELVDPATRGDPESPLRWTTKSTTKLADELTGAGHPVSPDTVGRLLKADGYSLQANVKTVEGKQHPDRDGQFRHINEQVVAFQAAGDPVASVDCKKKELVGAYRNGGREWAPAGEPERVNVHDFKGELGKAVPYASAFHDLAHVDLRQWSVIAGCDFRVLACRWRRVSPRGAPFSRRGGAVGPTVVRGSDRDR